jgi:hypothetical protein
MSAPVPGTVRLPDDSGNLGKFIRTQSRVVGGNPVHEHFFQTARLAQVLGVFYGQSSQITVAAAAQNGTSTGALWLHVPAAVTGKKARLRQLCIQSQNGSALATPTAPRIVAQRFTFTGTASGASGVTPAKVDSGQPNAILDVRSAVTGLTVALVAALGVGALIQAVTAVGAVAPVQSYIVPAVTDEDEYPIIAPGEGIVLFQDTAGTTSDTRVWSASMLWDEIDVT